MKKLEEGFESSKRTLINNPPERIHELYFMPTDLQRTFYRKGEQADTSERVGIFRAGEAHRQILKQRSLLKVSNDSMGYEWKPTGTYTAYASLSSLTDLLCGIKKIVEGGEVMQQRRTHNRQQKIIKRKGYEPDGAVIYPRTKLHYYI